MEWRHASWSDSMEQVLQGTVGFCIQRYREWIGLIFTYSKLAYFSLSWTGDLEMFHQSVCRSKGRLSPVRGLSPPSGQLPYVCWQDSLAN